MLHVTPGDEFATDRERRSRPASRVERRCERASRERAYLERLKKDAADKLTRRLGWMTRAHPFVLDGTRLIVPLYSDGFSFSLMAITDDWGATWKTSTPLVGPATSSRRSCGETTARSSRSCATTARRPSASQVSESTRPGRDVEHRS